METMQTLLADINGLRAVAPAPWRGKVKRVAVILTSSRSGSTLFKAALAGHPGIAALDGEMEPLLALTGNGFGHDPACASDAITTLRAADALADNVFDGLTVASAQLAPRAELEERWRKRLLLHFPAQFAEPAEHTRMQRALGEALAFICEHGDEVSSDEAVHALLGTVYWGERWRLDYYDGHMGPGEDRPFDQPAKIEEPPFVVPGLRRRRLTEQDAASKVLLFKTPSDAFRPGLYEQLFPQAEVRYIHLTRGYAQCVNGLIDGWLSPTGFFAHDMARAGVQLAIGGYSDQCSFGSRWWKFDLPPNWRALTGARLEQVCLNQWLSCHRHILERGTGAMRIAFEDFLAAPDAVLARACDWLGLPPPPTVGTLPVTMATDAPAAGRWHRRSDVLLPLAQQPGVAEVMAALGYSMDPESWQ